MRPSPSAGKITSLTSSARAAANSSASVSADSGTAGSLRISRTRSPASVPPGSRTPRASSPSASQSSPACVVLPDRSMPSKVTNRPRISAANLPARPALPTPNRTVSEALHRAWPPAGPPGAILVWTREPHRRQTMRRTLTLILGVALFGILAAVVVASQGADDPAGTTDSVTETVERTTTAEDNPDRVGDDDNAAGDISGPCDEAEHANDPGCNAQT